MDMHDGRFARWLTRARLALALSGALVPLAATAQDRMPQLRRDPGIATVAPIPAAERGIPTVVAERWHTITDGRTVVEGAAFDGADLLFCDVGASRIIRVTPEGRSSVVLDQPGLGAGGLALHRDGRLFAAAAGDLKRGKLGVVVPGDRLHELLPAGDYVPNDLVFDRQGGFYFTDFKGSVSAATGGVYHVAADLKTVTPVARNLALANGIALSPDGKHLWITEYGRNRLLRIDLKDGRPEVERIMVAYYFVGVAPDSMRVDAAGNIYVGMNGQGRVLVLNPGGIPIGQMLIPGRDRGLYLDANSLAIKPGTDEVYIVAAGGEEAPGAAVFRARGLARALPLFGGAR